MIEWHLCYLNGNGESTSLWKMPLYSFSPWLKFFLLLPIPLSVSHGFCYGFYGFVRSYINVVVHLKNFFTKWIVHINSLWGNQLAYIYIYIYIYYIYIYIYIYKFIVLPISLLSRTNSRCLTNIIFEENKNYIIISVPIQFLFEHFLR